MDKIEHGNVNMKMWFLFQYQNIRFIRNTTKAEFSIKPCFTGVNDGLTITLKHNTLDGLDNAKKLLLSLINRVCILRI